MKAPFRTKTEAKRAYKYLAEYIQRAPNAAMCDIRWKDTGEECHNYIITLFDTEGTVHDKYCFFNAGSIGNLLNLFGRRSAEDFEITAINEFIVI